MSYLISTFLMFEQLSYAIKKGLFEKYQNLARNKDLFSALTHPNMIKKMQKVLFYFYKEEPFFIKISTS